MKRRQRGAGLFSALALLLLVGAAILLWLPPRMPVVAPDPAPNALQGPVNPPAAN